MSPHLLSAQMVRSSSKFSAQGEDLACPAEGIDAVGDAIARGPNSDGCEF